MLPEDLDLKSGESHFRIDGNGIRRRDFTTAEELREWANTNSLVSRVHMAMFFARDNSGSPHTTTYGAAYVSDDGDCVAIKAMGMGRSVIDAVFEAIERRKQLLGQVQQDVSVRRRNRDDDPLD